MYKLIYDELREAVIEVSPNGMEKVVSDDFPSKPVYSPDGLHSAYIAPLEWEELGKLYMYDLKNGENKVCITPDEHNNIPKYAQWLNNDILLVIIGFGDGTVSIGGNLFAYSLLDGTLRNITNYPSNIQITKIKVVADDIILTGIEYIDDTMNEFRDFKENINKAEL